MAGAYQGAAALLISCFQKNPALHYAALLPTNHRTVNNVYLPTTNKKKQQQHYRFRKRTFGSRAVLSGLRLS